MKNVASACITALVLFIFSIPLSSHTARTEAALMVDEVTWYHFEIYDPDCGLMVYDGWVNWTGPGTYDGYCIDIVTEHCGDVSVSGRNVPAAMLDPRSQKVTKESLTRYTIRRIKG